MSRSSSPLALSVLTLTEPGDVQTTLGRITAFDDREFGFNHNQTWAAMPAALRGVLDPNGVATSFSKAPKRVQRCVAALCALGQIHPLETRSFRDYPEAGLRTVHAIDWDPEVTVRVKGSCWFIEGDKARIPLLHPRKAALDPFRLALYVKLGRQAFCRDDWADADIDVVDLSGDGEVTARFVALDSLPKVTDRDLRDFIETYVAAKRLADMKRAGRAKKLVTTPMDELLDLA